MPELKSAVLELNGITNIINSASTNVSFGLRDKMINAFGELDQIRISTSKTCESIENTINTINKKGAAFYYRKGLGAFRCRNRFLRPKIVSRYIEAEKTVKKANVFFPYLLVKKTVKRWYFSKKLD